MLASFLTFFAAATVLIMVPGPDSMLVLRNAIRYGAGPGFATALGTLTGLSVWVLAAAVGISALIHTSAVGYAFLRYAGAVYLLLLGIFSLLAKRQYDTFDREAGEPSNSGWRNYIVGFTTNVLNPKIGVFFVAFLPAFVPIGSSVSWTSGLFGAVFVIETAIWLFLILFVARRLFGWLCRPTVRQRLEQVTGIVLIGFAARLALSSS